MTRKSRDKLDERREAIIQRDLVAVQSMPALHDALSTLPSKRARLLALHGLVMFYDERAAARIADLCTAAFEDELYDMAAPSESADKP